MLEEKFINDFKSLLSQFFRMDRWGDYDLGYKTLDESVNTKHCNILSKIFFRVKQPEAGKAGAVYTSSVYIKADKNLGHLHFGFQGSSNDTRNPSGLSHSQVKDIHKSLSEYLSHTFVINQIDSTIPKLLIAMQRSGNNIVGEKLFEYESKVLAAAKNKRQSTTEESNYKASLSSLLNFSNLSNTEQQEFDSKYLQYLLKNEDFNKFSLELIENLIPIDMNVSIGKFLNDVTADNLHIAPSDDTDQDRSHVEAKALHDAQSKAVARQEKTTIFHIGLASIKEEAYIGCCACCSSEFEAIKSLYDIEIYRSADYITNFPSGAYELSKRVSESDDIAKKFFEIVIARFDSVLKAQGLSADHQLFEKVAWFEHNFEAAFEETYEEEAELSGIEDSALASDLLA